jgi:DNA polymerase-3 subunit gamma/tau
MRTPPVPSTQEPPPWLDAPPPLDDIGASAVATLERPMTRPVAAEPTAARLQPAATPVHAAPEATAEDDVGSPAWEVQRTALGDRWADVVAQLNERGAIVALVRELAQQAELVRAEGTAWLLRVERETLRAQPLRDKLQAALATVVAPAPQLEVEPGVAQDSPARREAAERERRQREAERIIRNDPLVQELMSQFRTARIVPGSIKPV